VDISGAVEVKHKSLAGNSVDCGGGVFDLLCATTIARGVVVFEPLFFLLSLEERGKAMQIKIAIRKFLFIQPFLKCYIFLK
jgi:hypothetical protein